MSFHQNKHSFPMEKAVMICILPLQVRRLRFRRPRPKLIDVENPDGDLVGSPVELKEQGEDHHPWHAWHAPFASAWPCFCCEDASGQRFEETDIWGWDQLFVLLDWVLVYNSELGVDQFNVKLIMRTGQIELGNWFPRYQHQQYGTRPQILHSGDWGTSAL